MGELARRQYTYEQYLSMLEGSSLKLEYLDGDVYAMGGGTPAHAALGARVASLLAAQLPERCVVYSADLKVLASGLTTFPDASVVCGSVQRAKNDRNVVTNPMLLVEVTSPSTEAFDRGAKLKRYQGVASLKAVVFVSHRSPELTLVERRGSRWRTTTFGPKATLDLPDLLISLSVERCYRGITLE